MRIEKYVVKGFVNIYGRERKGVVVKIAVIGIVCSLLVMYLKNLKPEYGQLLLLAVGVVLSFFAFAYLKNMAELLEELTGKITLQKSYLTVLLKMIGIAYVCEFASNLCKDAGCQTIAGQVEMIGKLSMLFISTPIVTSLIEMIGKLT